MVLDNPLYRYSITKDNSDVLYKSVVEPDIYFDEEENNNNISDTFLGARLVISQLISASNGSLSKLQQLMCVFSGMSLRQTAIVAHCSHESVRLTILSIKDKYPSLYSVLVDKKRFQVTSISPFGITKKWKLEDTITKKIKFTDNLSEWARTKKITYHLLRYVICKKKGIYKNIKITRNF